MKPSEPRLKCLALFCFVVSIQGSVGQISRRQMLLCFERQMNGVNF